MRFAVSARIAALNGVMVVLLLEVEAMSSSSRASTTFFSFALPRLDFLDVPFVLVLDDAVLVEVAR